MQTTIRTDPHRTSRPAVPVGVGVPDHRRHRLVRRDSRPRQPSVGRVVDRNLALRVVIQQPQIRRRIRRRLNRRVITGNNRRRTRRRRRRAARQVIALRTVELVHILPVLHTRRYHRPQRRPRQSVRRDLRQSSIGPIDRATPQIYVRLGRATHVDLRRPATRTSRILLKRTHP